MSTVTFQDNEYEWEDIEGKGRCLVPTNDPLSLENIRAGRRYRNKKGKIQTIMSVFRPEGREFWTVLNSCCIGSAYGRPSYGYSDCSYDTKEQLADAIKRKTKLGYSTAFAGWVD